MLMNIQTIGDFCSLEDQHIAHLMGKTGLALKRNLLGSEEDPVQNYFTLVPPKSIGNGTTTIKDISSREEIEKVVAFLAEKVSHRLIQAGFEAKTLTITLKDNTFKKYGKSKTIAPCFAADVLIKETMILLDSFFDYSVPIRAVRLRCSNLQKIDKSRQLSFFDEKQEDKKTTDQTQPETKKPESNFEEEDSSAGQAKKVNLFDQLFANNNKLLTVNGSDFAITNETRRMLALFSDGTYLVSKDNRFDGAVYNFEANVKRRKIPIKAPRYVTLNEIAAIYAYAERGAGTVDVSAEEAEDMQMQIDFINIIQRASQKKVSDVHIIVGSSSTVLFRENGIMVKQNEYGGEWGEAFVRAVFASADISDSNYSQNEFQGAQKLGSTPLRGSKGKLMLLPNVAAAFCCMIKRKGM